ncbi:MAG: hypothetical protein WC506_03895 [Candidatus Micrarchaeia archaeon]
MANTKQLFGLVLASLAFMLVFFVGIIMFSGMGGTGGKAASGTLLANAITANSIAPASKTQYSMATAYKNGNFMLGNSLSVGSNTLYYLYFPAGTAKGNANALSVLAGSNFISEVVGLKAAGEAVDFSPKPCAQSADSDFAASGFFKNSGAAEVSPGSVVCVRHKGSASGYEEIKVTGLNADSIQLVQ